MVFGGNNATRLAGRDFATPDLEAIHDAERFIAYANSQGITLWIMPWWSANNLDKSAGAEKMRRWTRYMVHRLAAYNVIWNVGGEYNMYDYGGLGLQFWKELGALMRREDGGAHAIGVHNTPPGWSAGEMGDSAQWSTSLVLHDQPWLDFNGSQVGHGKWRNELVPQIIASDYARRPAKPTVVTEPWYEFAEGMAPAMDVRFAAWSAMLSGAAGHTYGGGHQWWADIPDPSLTPRKDQWPRPPLSVDTLDFPGAVSMGFLAKFLKGIEWWKLEPHPELVLEYPQPLRVRGGGTGVCGVCAVRRAVEARSAGRRGIRPAALHVDRPGQFEGGAVRDSEWRRDTDFSHAGGLPGKPGVQRLAASRSPGQRTVNAGKGR